MNHFELPQKAGQQVTSGNRARADEEMSGYDPEIIFHGQPGIVPRLEDLPGVFQKEQPRFRGLNPPAQPVKKPGS